MPSSPRKRARAKPREASKHVDDSDSDESYNNMPALVHSDSDDESRDEWPRRHKAYSNAESVEIWLDLSKATRERHTRVMKIYLLSPFLFESVEQDDKWINWAHECRLLSNKMNCDPSVQIPECMEVVDIIEEAFNKTVMYMLSKEDSEETEKALRMMDKINTLDKLENAIICAESFPLFLKIRERIKTTTFKTKSDVKLKADTSLLFAFQQIYDHVRKLTRENIDLAKQFDESCRDGEQQTTDLKKKGNNHFKDGKYKAAISAYSKAILMSQYNHILYGNRAQSYLRTGELWQAVADGRRSVVLKPDWVKGQYRYAQAYFDLGNIENAISANRQAKQACHKNSKDLDSQYERFLKERDIKARKIAKNVRQKEAQLKMPSDLDDLPDLVDAESTDTSGESGDDDEEEDEEEDNIDSSDNSNSEYESVPELVTDSSKDSDSDDDCEQKLQTNEEKLRNQGLLKARLNHTSQAEKQLKRKKRTEQKIKQEQGKRKEVEIGEGVLKRRDLYSCLKQGSKNYLDGKWMASISHYGQAVQMLSVDDAFQVFKIKRIDYMLILYSHGTALFETGIHKELLEAIRHFKTIIIRYKDIKFPLAFYGLSRVFHRQNRFSDALDPLNKGLNMVKIGEFGEYRWPGTQTIIEQSEPGKLEIAFETIISLCQNPPRPDAICRYTHCHQRHAIYLTDPDYKGYVRLICGESCKIDYHPYCWKKYRSVYGDKNGDKSGDKDYLEDECLTPDCTAPVVQIQIYVSDGLKTEFAVENVRVKQKQTKQGKIKTHGYQKQPKTDKQKKEENKVEINPDATDGENQLPAQDTTNTNIKNKPTNTKPDAVEEIDIEKVMKQNPEVQTIPDTRDTKEGDAGVYILRKNEERLPDDLLVFKGAKGKSKKKKVKNVQSLDEFLKDHGGEVFKAPFGAVEEEDEIPDIPTMIPPSQWSEDELVAPFAVPPHLRSEVQAFEREYQAGTDQGLQQPFSAHKDVLPSKEKPSLDPIEDYIISLFTETLNAHGPMDVADARIIEPISFLPESYQQKIQDCGGIKHFLMNSEQFVVQGNYVMLPNEFHFQEIVKHLNGTKTDIKTNTSKAVGSNFTGFSDSLSPISQSSELTPIPLSAPPLRTSQIDPIVQDVIPSASPSTTSKSKPGNDNKRAKAVFREGVFTSANLPPSSNGVGKLNPKRIVFCQNENINFELQKFAAPLEKVGIAPTSKSIVNLITSMTLGDSSGDGTITADKKEPLKKDISHLLSQIDVCTVSEQHVNQMTKSRSTKNQETNFPVVYTPTDKTSAEEKCIDSKSGQDRSEPTASLNTPRAGNTGSDGVVGVKSKGIQTQLQVKAKGVMTDTIPEPYKMEYMKASQEKEEIQRKLQEVNDKLNNIQRKHEQDLDKMKKKYSDVQSEKEKLSKDLQSAKQEGKSELKKMDKMCEEKEKVAASLEQRFKLEQDRYQSTIAGLKVELDAKDLELQNEKVKMNSIVSQKEESIKKANGTRQQQESRAQDAEVKLLELRRDVGLKFLERSIHEATYTANNLITVRKASPVPSTKLDDLISTWKLYFHDCQQKAKLCTNTFNVQIQEVGNGRVLSSLPPLAIPGPAAYPGQPILQLTAPMISHIQSSLQLTGGEMPVNIPSQAFPHIATQQPRPVVPNPIPSPTPQRMPLPQKGPTVPTKPTPVVSVQHNVPEATASAAAAKPEVDSKGRPSNSFERIMLRLSTAYPYLARAELTALIKEVRQSKNGTLTGLSMDEIVQSVDLLVDAKVKVGVIRVPPSKQTTGHVRTTPSQSKVPTVNGAINNFTIPAVNGATNFTIPAVNGATNNFTPITSTDSGSQSSLTLEIDDDDPCVICHDDMKSSTVTVTLECGHKYHNKCIRKWLLGEQSTCPTCRVHALLPDEFPRLK